MCGMDDLDAIAIDNIAIFGTATTTTTSSTPTTTTETTTTTTTTTTTKAPVINEDCPNTEDYSPCSCWLVFTGVYVVECLDVSLDSVNDVFERTTPANLFVFSFRPTIAENAPFIPEDLIGNHHAEIIDLFCASANYPMKLDENAFRSSAGYTTQLSIHDCDMNLMGGFDFSFLSVLASSLESLKFQSTLRIHLAAWNTLPALPKLTQFILFDNQGMNEWSNFPILVHGLDEISLSQRNSEPVTDGGISRLLNWALESSEETLRMLYLDYNALTKVPEQIQLFNQLYTLAIRNQPDSPLPSIETDSFVFSAPVRFFYLSSVGVETIEPNSFQGDFRIKKRLSGGCVLCVIN